MAAKRQLAAGVIDYALVVGVELFNNITAQGFSSLGLLTSSVMKPFDASRDGLVLGESVAALVLGSARQRDASHFYLAGGANRSDAHSITSITADGSTVASVMNQALASANCKPEAIAAIKVHGTASLANDEAEAAGMHRVFASLPKVCALKPFIGHTLGACGLTELILFYRALEAGFLIATPGISVEPGELRVALNQQPQFSPSMSNSYLLNYFGFGGNNSALVIRRNGGGGAP
jgi:3-oxoacyl-[acyl-carrier-protein] synthase-1